MKHFGIIAVLALGLNTSAQTTLAVVNTPVVTNPELPNGIITGDVKTTDNQPAASVSIQIKGTNKITLTDDQGSFSFTNLKEGSYTLIISMVGLKSQEKTVDVKKDQTVPVQITLQENARELDAVVIATGKTLNDRTLSIGKVPIHPMDLPQSVAVIGQGLIRDQQAQRLSDVVKNVNGVYLATTRGSSQETFAARGYSFGSSNLFKNGSRVNSGAMPEVSSLDRVEVLKGSAAILFGQVAPGGVVNMITKQPKFKFGGEVSFRAGSYDLYKPAFDIYGPITSNLAYRLNGTYETANSYRDQVHTKRYYVNPSFLYKLSNRTTLVLEGDYLNHEFTPDFGIGTIGDTKIPDVPRSRYLGASWSYATTQQATATASISHKFSEAWRLQSSLSYQFYKRDYFATERIQAAANGDWVRPLGRTLTDEDYYSAQVNLNGNFKTGNLEHTFLSGVDADRYFTTAYGFSYPAVAGLPAGSYDRINIFDLQKYQQRTDMPVATAIRKTEAPINRIGGYVQDLVKLSDKFNLLAGIRWSYVETRGIDSLSLVNGATTKGSNRYDKAFSPRFGIVYKPAATTSLFASYANSFTVNTGQDVYGAAIAPSIIDQYEVGIKNDFFKGKLSTNVTVYRIINNNLAQMAPFKADGVTPNSDATIKVLSGQTTSDGWEVDLAAHPVEGMDITAGYSHNYIRYTKTSPEKGSFITGERLVNNPEHTANGSIFYTFGQGALKGFKLGGSVFYVGDRFGGWNNNVGQAQTYNRLIAVDGFTTADIAAGYSFKKVSLLAKVSNLTNTLNYYVHENYSINPIPPRQLVATVSYKF
ncbi:MAG TPA: TonB-dependent receptor [Flavisolibacter sp.]|nr:TonB-dependent receptor [Flavisolibacter sp.]